MALTQAQLLAKLAECRRRHPFGQFGTTDDECTDNGALGCTQTVWRFIAFVYKGKWYSHDQLSKMSGYPCGGGSTNRGMYVSESIALVKALGLPMVYKANLTSSQLLVASKIGPVLFATRYGSWPNWAHYRGVTRPRPWARPYDKAGRNQFTGFVGSHANCLLGYQRITTTAGTFVRNDAFVFEPNHDSPARPENVAYDVVTQSQLDLAYNDTVKRLGWSSTMAFIPTRQPTFPGGL
jgi:hypothetical protein